MLLAWRGQRSARAQIDSLPVTNCCLTKHIKENSRTGHTRPTSTSLASRWLTGLPDAWRISHI